MKPSYRYTIEVFLALAAIFIIAIALECHAHAADTPATAPAKPVEHVLTDQQKLDLRNIQVELQSNTIQQVQVQQQAAQEQKRLQEQSDELQRRLAVRIGQIIKEFGLKPEEWQLDRDLTLVPTPKKEGK